MIDKSEVLRYLKIKKQPDPETDRLIDQCIKECEEKAAPKHIYKICELSFNKTGVVAGGFQLPGEDIKNHLSGCSKAVLMAATLGIGIDSLINFYSVRDIGRSIVLDACATALIESVCDECEEIIKLRVEKSDINITTRYSPGYGDLPIEIQQNFINVLDTPRKIGLYCNQNSILIPRKSVTAIIGLGEKTRDFGAGKNGCNNCNLARDCSYRKDGQCGF